jgi:nanoRNase/pAp phosphatase (c-di-AMP/oligoRNAs hydrolase)
MYSRLVLGCGSVGHGLVVELRDRDEELLVAARDAGRAETLRNDGIPAQQVDVTDPTAVAGFGVRAEPPVGFVAVLGDDPTINRRAVAAATEAFPEAHVLAYVGRGATTADREWFADRADTTFDPGAAVLDHVHDVLATGGPLVRGLREALADLSGPLAIVTHDNPDPDAIAAALALQRVVEALGHEAEVCYYGDISHQENRALVNLLEYDLRELAPDEDLSAFGGFALVDHSRPGVNDGLPEGTDVDVVIDHHPPRGPVDATFQDLRSDVGATSTLLVDYLRQLDLGLDSEVATGLLFGIRVDTKDFSREVSVRDFEAVGYLVEHADTAALDRIESPSVSIETLELLATAIKNRQREGAVLTSCVGYVSDRDALAQAADHLLDLEGVASTLVYGIMDGTVYLSARSRGAEFDLGEALREAFGQIGSAGGHADMAGAQIPLGLLGDTEASEDRDQLVAIVSEMVHKRFCEVVSTVPPDVPVPLVPDAEYGEE